MGTPRRRMRRRGGVLTGSGAWCGGLLAPEMVAGFRGMAGAVAARVGASGGRGSSHGLKEEDDRPYVGFQSNGSGQID